jgi:hypothetical protein
MLPIPASATGGRARVPRRAGRRPLPQPVLFPWLRAVAVKAAVSRRCPSPADTAAGPGCSVGAPDSEVFLLVGGRRGGMEMAWRGSTTAAPCRAAESTGGAGPPLGSSSARADDSRAVAEAWGPGARLARGPGPGPASRPVHDDTENNKQSPTTSPTNSTAAGAGTQGLPTPRGVPPSTGGVPNRNWGWGVPPGDRRACRPRGVACEGPQPREGQGSVKTRVDDAG